ncbi:glycosyltransferase family 4 protein [Candidatus Shapirobacteria bacterium]|nr:glycosyltransferase family 4 protein [Candidatus Shapirobacteria bacterium]
MKKAAIYDPYLDTLGGGERYTLTVADCLNKNDFRVDIFWDDKSIKSKIEPRLGIKVERINFLPNIFNKSGNEKKRILRNYDLIFFLSDGSIPFLTAKQNLLHFQVPFHGVGGKNLLNRLKLRKIKAIICNSLFTKKFIDQEYGVQGKVIYPPVNVEAFKVLKKENLILNVGRFTDLLHQKRQDVLIKAFKDLKARYPQETEDWRLILAGGDKEGGNFVKKLKTMAIGLPIQIMTNPQFNYLKRLYGQAKIFWTAAGFGIDEEKEPEKVEHFGITTVEAMAAGCVPVVIRKGGQPEIVKEGENGLLWEEEKELVEKTLSLIKKPKEILRISQKAQKSALAFSEKNFCQKLMNLIK